MICRHSEEVRRQRDGFVELSEILIWFAQRRRGDHVPTIDDIESIVYGDGRNAKMRSEWGVTNNGERAIRTSQGHSAGAGATSDYSPRLHSPGLVVHGSTLENAFSICQNGLNRMGRLHVHLGKMANTRPVGMRPGSEVAVAIDGNRCVTEGM